MNKHFQQSDFWRDFKCAHNWNAVKQDDINVLYRVFKAAFFGFTIAYVPLAPEFRGESESDESILSNQTQTEEYAKLLKSFAFKIKSVLPKNTICARFDIPLDFENCEKRDDFVVKLLERASASKEKSFKIIKNAVDIQPPDSVVLDLTKSEDELLSAMKSKWRYNIRYAQKHGVKVRAVDADCAGFEKSLSSFYELYKTTAQRDGIGIHPREYYEDLLKRGAQEYAESKAEKVTLYVAENEGEDLAAIITLFTKNEAVYLYGCSGNNKRNLMPTYAVQWTAIRDAKSFGSKIYDFYGIPPSYGNPPSVSENHPMRGLYLFKTGFGGKEIHRPGTFDVPLRSSYFLFAIAEKLRAFWHKKVMKKIRGR